MKKLKDNVIVKVLISLITIAIMATIIVFVFDYYTKVAKKSANNNSNNHPTKVNEENEYEFIKYDNKKTRIFLGKNPFYLSILDTDGGRVLALDDLALTSYNNDTNIEYFILNEVLIVVSKSKSNNSINSVVFINSNKKMLSYEVEKNGYITYSISKPIINEMYTESFVIKGNKVFITFTMSNKNGQFNLNNDILLKDLTKLEYKKYGISENTLVEYVYEINCDDNKLDEKYAFKYTLNEYLNDK